MIPVKSEIDRFYNSVAGYFSSLFPLNPEQLAFVEGEPGGLKDKSILDVGCGTGELALGLAEKGAFVTAIDLNDALLNEARNNRGHERIVYRKANMLHIARLFGRSKFDALTCFGNTLVHLMNPMQMRDFFSGVLTVLKPGGLFFLQIVNYDYIFGERIDTLPDILTEKVRFERKYTFMPGTREIRFRTRLTLLSTGEVFDNETDLLGLGSEDLIQLMDVAGLKEIRTYSDYRKSPAGGKHLPLVMVSSKHRQEETIYGKLYRRESTG